jgi:hypothetical protein
MTRLTSRTADLAVFIIMAGMFDLIAFLVSALSSCLPLYPGNSVLRGRFIVAGKYEPGPSL